MGKLTKKAKEKCGKSACFFRIRYSRMRKKITRDFIAVELPNIDKLEKIRVRLDKPRLINYKWKNPPKTYLPADLKKHENRAGVYIIVKDNKPIYVGSTSNLHQRILTHRVLKNNPDIKFIYFLEEEDRDRRVFFEMFYKFCLLGS